MPPASTCTVCVDTETHSRINDWTRDAEIICYHTFSKVHIGVIDKKVTFEHITPHHADNALRIKMKNQWLQQHNMMVAIYFIIAFVPNNLKLNPNEHFTRLTNDRSYADIVFENYKKIYDANEDWYEFCDKDDYNDLIIVLKSRVLSNIGEKISDEVPAQSNSIIEYLIKRINAVENSLNIANNIPKTLKTDGVAETVAISNVSDNKSNKINRLPKYQGVLYIHGQHRVLEWLHDYDNHAITNNVVDADKIKWFFKAIDTTNEGNRFIKQWYSEQVQNVNLSFSDFRHSFLVELGMSDLSYIDKLIEEIKTDVHLKKGPRGIRQHVSDFKMRCREIILLRSILTDKGMRAPQEFNDIHQIRQFIISLSRYDKIKTNVQAWYREQNSPTLDEVCAYAITMGDDELHFEDPTNAKNRFPERPRNPTSAMIQNNNQQVSSTNANTNTPKVNIPFTPTTKLPTPALKTEKPTTGIDSLTKLMHDMKIKKVDNSRNNAVRDLSKVTCYICGNLGHYAMNRDTGERCKLPPRDEYKGYLCSVTLNNATEETEAYDQDCDDDYLKIYYTRLLDYDQDEFDSVLYKMFYFNKFENVSDEESDNSEDFHYGV